MPFRRCIYFALIAFNAAAQQYPPDGARLSHVQVMFEYPAVKQADLYELEIISSADKSTVYKGSDSSTAQLVSRLKFGTGYTWHYSAYEKGKKLFTSPDHKFETVRTKAETIFKANAVTHDSAQVMPGLIFLDQGVVIDRKGNVVLVSDSLGIEKRDFSLTPSGTVTYLQRNRAFERKLNGELIWQSKEVTSGKAVVNGYHHDMIRLDNGNYLVMCKIAEPSNPQFRKRFDEGIAELTPANELVWLWKENDHISDTSRIETTHSNSIFLDEKENKIYVSSRDIHTVFIIDRGTGKIVKSIGYPLNASCEHYPQAWFFGQHSVQLLPTGNILLFNNNSRPPAPGGITGIMEINNPGKANAEVALQFFYFYDFGRSENHCPKGGDVNKLANGNYLVSSGSHNRNFELTPASRIVWECRPEMLDTVTGIWTGAGSYRINYEASLYPSFFTADVLYSAGKPGGFRISNKGSRDDDYAITVKNSKGKSIAQFTKQIGAGKSERVAWPAAGAVVSVRSKSEPGRVKEIKIN